MKRKKIDKFIDTCLNNQMYYPENESISADRQNAIDEGLFDKKGVAYTLATIVHPQPFYKTKKEAEQHFADVGDIKVYVRIIADNDGKNPKIGINDMTGQEVFYTKKEFIEKYGEI